MQNALSTAGAVSAAPIEFGPPADYFIVEPNSRWAYTYAETYTAAIRKLGQCMIDDPLRFVHARLVHAEKFQLDIEASYLNQPIVEITAEDFTHMLEVLPPLAWSKDLGLEGFNCREMTHGLITSQYAKLGDRYFSKPVRHGDLATYITPELIADFAASDGL